MKSIESDPIDYKQTIKSRLTPLIVLILGCGDAFFDYIGYPSIQTFPTCFGNHGRTRV